ncbi:MAG: glycoside hydrolase family 78 protein [Candidatus Aminicenantes bacterium]|nr:glycoside hydrolase family 78 protein [Candidatus Aminicenantes bacterium]
MLNGQSRAQSSMLSLYDLKCEYKIDPIGIDVMDPRLSWKIAARLKGTLQTAYEIRAGKSIESLNNPDQLLWNTGKVLSDTSIHVPYSGPGLSSRQRIYWQVRIWDNKGHSSAWSRPAFWEMGLLRETDWKAQWIESLVEENKAGSNPCPMLRKEFKVNREVNSARLYVSALGLYEIELNGKKVGDQVFTPGWTSYDLRLQYQTYDVTTNLQSGLNALGAILGDGWYRGYLGFSGQRNIYGNNLALLLQLHIHFKDGSSEIIETNVSWRSSTGPILMSDIYNGESYDARLEKAGWSQPGFDDSEWLGVRILDHPKNILVSPEGPPVRQIEELKIQRIFQTPAGEKVADFGQNMVGRVRLKVSGPAGTTIKLQHAEVLDTEGNLYLDNLRAARQLVTYTLKGQGQEIYEPHFTFQGFRYVAVEGFPGELTTDSLTGIVIHSDFPISGDFECSDPMINQLQHNIIWGLKGNFLDVPTDCPQRDERLGWTGDAQVFARTACFNAEAAAFYTKWLKDLSADQQEDGAVPHVVPNALTHKERKGFSASAGWADAAVIVPWTVYLCYGDTRILQQQYPSMKGWVDYMAKKAGASYFWNTDFTFGDWLSFSTDRSDYPGATTDKNLIAQAYFAYSTFLLSKTAAILGFEQDAEYYADLLKEIKNVFLDEFVTPKGRLSSHTQTAYCLALGFDLLPDSIKDRAAERLANDVNLFKHITTGFLGAPLICPVLSSHGYLDEAYMLLNRKEYPSWLYPITKGATTIWERWDGIKPDGSFQDPGMNSFNHYAYGAIGEWLYRVVAGIEIDPKHPGYKHVLIRPHPGGDLDHASARINSMYGLILSEWKKTEDNFQLTLTIPPNTHGTVYLPEAKQDTVLEGGKPLSSAEGVRSIKYTEGKAIIEIGSGKYIFLYPYGKHLSDQP